VFFILAAVVLMTVDIYGADGFGGSATGGAGGTTVTVSNLADFQYYATRSTPYIVRVSGTISLDGISGKLQPASNKTIEGVDHNATVIGRIDLHTGCNNVIVRNLNITSLANDGISVWGATNIFITHCNIYDCADGAIDMNNGTDYVTVSWCRFNYPTQAAHRFVHIADQAHITFHHNWYDYGCDQRMPASTGGTIHMYNNYFSCTGNYYCSNARDGAQILSENNYYTHVNSPIGISSGTTGLIKTTGNIYDSCTGTIHPGTDTVFTPTYSYTPDAVQDVPAIVIAGAGNVLYGDYNGDKSVNTEDFYLFIGFWLNPNSRPAFYQDLNGDGLVSLYEFKSFTQNWLEMY
jgi:pectate lyase